MLAIIFCHETVWLSFPVGRFDNCPDTFSMYFQPYLQGDASMVVSMVIYAYIANRSHFSIMKRFSSVSPRGERRAAAMVSLNVGGKQFDSSPDTLSKALYFQPYLQGDASMAVSVGHLCLQCKLRSSAPLLGRCITSSRLALKAACSMPLITADVSLLIGTRSFLESCCSSSELKRYQLSVTSKQIVKR